MKIITLIVCLFFLQIGFAQSLNKKTIDEINLVRTNPKSYIPIIKEYIKSQKTLYSSKPIIIKCNEIISLLDTIKPMDPIVENKYIDSSLAYHKVDSINQKVIHDDVLLRLNKYGKFKSVGENIYQIEDPRGAVVLLLVDIGSNGHRDNILNRKFTDIGVREITFKNKKYFIQDFASK